MPTLQFKGKNIIWNHHLSIPYHTLEEVSKLNFQADKGDGNLIIEGDNLLALKALLPQYAGKIKCIYIDPPYNTGNEGWVYNDRVNSPLIREWLGKEVGKDDLTKHDKWLCMMVPRLRLLRELLADDGVMFISIDENEQQRLRLLMEELFNNNHIVTFVWTGRSGKGGTTSQVEMNHEYIECFARDLNKISIKPVIRIQPEGRFSDKKGSYSRERLRQWGQGDRREDRPRMYFPIPTPDGSVAYPIRPDGSEGRWRFGEGTVLKMLEEDNLDFERNDKGGWEVFRKIRAGQERVSAADSLLDDLGTASTGTIELKTLFSGKKVLETVKPSSLIKYLIDLVTWDDKSTIILDSFAGSGTTMHAVMDLNKEDGGNRKCIMVQMTEATEKEPKKNICKDITRERVKRAIEKYGYKSGFKYLRVGDPIDAETLLSGTLPKYRQFAKYVYYLCTGGYLEDESSIDEKTYFVGEHKKKAIYLIYKQDYDTLTRLALNLKEAERILSEQKNKKLIVYAPACFLDEEYLEEKNIEFVGIPYNLFRRNG